MGKRIGLRNVYGTPRLCLHLAHTKPLRPCSICTGPVRTTVPCTVTSWLM